MQFGGGGNLMARYFGNAQEEVASPSQAGTVYWAAADNEGSLRDLVDNNGDPVDHLVYTAFGQTAYESNPSAPHLTGYAGEYLSPGTSLVLSGARWYEPATGTWLSEDPSGFGGGDANLSRYVGNSPTNATDPSGEISTAQVLEMASTPMFLWPLLFMQNAQSQSHSAGQSQGQSVQIGSAQYLDCLGWVRSA